MDIQEILKQKDVKIIDVREPYEYQMDHTPNSVNMPLSGFGDYVEEIKKMEGPKVFYCQSGNRSGQAVSFLNSIGEENVYNGGSLVLMKSFLVV